MISSSAVIFRYLFLGSNNCHNEHTDITESLPKSTLADDSMSGKAFDFFPLISNHEIQQYNSEVNTTGSHLLEVIRNA